MKSMEDLHVIQLGAGAVGSHSAQLFTEANVGKLTIVDKDCYEQSNFVKSSPLLDPDTDRGRPKATALTRRLHSIAKNTEIHAAFCDLTRLGPFAFLGADVVALGLDSTTVKLYVAHVLSRLPVDKRPVVLLGGTYEDFYVGRIHPPGAPCLRCALDPGPAPDRIWSCTDPGYLVDEDDSAKDKATPAASYNAAKASVDLLNEYLAGNLPEGESIRVAPTGRGIFIRDPECPCCTHQPVDKWTVIPGDHRSTLGEVFLSIKDVLGTDQFSVRVQRRKLGHRTYDSFVLKDACLGCGKVIPVFNHTSLISNSEVLCPECKARHHMLFLPHRYDGTKVLRVFPFKGTPVGVLGTPMYFLGFTVGDFIEVILSDGSIRHFLLENDIGILKNGLFLP